MTNAELWVLDRIEDGRTAVLVSPSGEERMVPRSRLPTEAREGDALREAPGEEAEAVDFAVDPEATERLRKQAENLRSSLRKGPSGPISL